LDPESELVRCIERKTEGLAVKIRLETKQNPNFGDPRKLGQK
jgi:hypothetical protein